MKKYIRKNIYNWHRITSLLIALPVLLWTVSGFLHPVMNSFKPAVKSQSIAPLKIEATKIKISLPDALHQNAIEAINSFRLVQMGDGYYYQLALNSKNEKQYLSCADGKWLKSGDALYAEYLAQQFMNVANKNGDAGHHHGSRNHFKQASNIEAVAATVTEVRQLKSFDAEYKGSQKILPVYKVSFDREDSIRLYVETGTDKMVYAVDRRKAAFSRFFSVAHSWSFLNGMGKAKSVLIGFFSLLCLASSVFGFYIYNISKARKRSAVQKRTWAKRTHRITGNIFLATTMLYAFSGGWHALKKVPDDSGKKGLQYVSSFTPGELHFSLPQLSKNLKAGEQLSNISSIKMKGEIYWQLSAVNAQSKQVKKYIHQPTGKEMKDGDLQYAQHAARSLSRRDDVKSVKEITAFNTEYSMMNKRLPVVQMAYQNGESYFMETSTGIVAAIVNGADRAERFSFSNLHMHHYAEKWSGKGLRNTILITTTLGLLLVACTGIMMYVKKRWL